MAVYSADLKISKYSLLAFLYFFFNSVFLPKGLLYTTALSPLFYYRVILAKRKTYALPFFIFLGAYDFIHLLLGIDLLSFLVSNLLFILTYFCVIAIHHFVNQYESFPKLYKHVVLLNAALVLLALPFFFTPKQYQEWFWYINKLTKGIAEFPRLALFTYEASYYSLLLIPIWFYYVLKFIFNDIQTNKWFMLLLVSIPMLLALSFGVIGASILSALVLCFVFWKRIFKHKRSFILFTLTCLSTLTVFTLLWILYPDNAFFIRLSNIFSGADTSANGRTVDSFAMAWRIADMKSLWFGSGLGQIKLMAPEVVHNYFNYWGKYPRYDIPNAMGETLAIFGIFGLILRLALEIYLFVKTKVQTNYYRLALFTFIFIYQFTGSFITNTVEYVIWIIAFSKAFEQFKVLNK